MRMHMSHIHCVKQPAYEQPPLPAQMRMLTCSVWAKFPTVDTAPCRAHALPPLSAIADADS